MALSVTDMMKGESPKSRIRPTVFGAARKNAGRKRNCDLRRKKKSVTHAAETACERTVASAAPFTPMPKAKIKSGSSPIFSTAPMATVAMEVKLNPCAVMNGFRPKESMTKIVPVPYTNRYSLA